MTMERDVSNILRELERTRRDDEWGSFAKMANQSRAMASGLDQSATGRALASLTGSMEERSRDQVVAARRIASSVDGLASTMRAGMDSLAAAVAEQRLSIDAMSSLLASPLGTAAAERFRRASETMAQGWDDEALAELEASLESDPYASITHYYHGIVLTRLGRHTEAVLAFGKAVKYAGTYANLRPVAAGAALMAVRAAEVAGAAGTAEPVVRDALSKASDCPELLLVASPLLADLGLAERALRIAPELALSFVASGDTRADAVVHKVRRDPDGPVENAAVAIRLANELVAGQAAEMPETTPEAMAHHAYFCEVAPILLDRAGRELAEATSRSAHAAREASAASADLERCERMHTSEPRRPLIAGESIAGFVALALVPVVLLWALATTWLVGLLVLLLVLVAYTGLSRGRKESLRRRRTYDALTGQHRAHLRELGRSRREAERTNHWASVAKDDLQRVSDLTTRLRSAVRQATPARTSPFVGAAKPAVEATDQTATLPR